MLESITNLRDRADEALVDLWENRRRELKLAAGGVLVAAVLGAGAYWWFEVRFRPPPSIFDSPVDDVLGYFALDDFSKLPVEERIRFLMELADRFRAGDQAESALMAAFLAGLSGPAREQATQNARVLAKDILADGARNYVNLPPAERGKYIEEWVVKWSKMGERLATGKERERSDSDRIGDFKRQSERGESRMEGREVPDLDDTRALGFLDFWQSEVEVASTPVEQGQIAKFLDDVRGHFSKAF